MWLSQLAYQSQARQMWLDKSGTPLVQGRRVTWSLGYLTDGMPFERPVLCGLGGVGGYHNSPDVGPRT